VVEQELVGKIFVYGYFAILGILCLYGFHRFLMVYLYYRNKKHAPRPKEEFRQLPPVTVQLPVYNELYVVERLIDAVCAFDYPKELLEVQVLDDSTDESVEVTARKVEEMRKRGYDVRHIRRPDRVGYKAGALEYGMKRAKADFLAVFDADFVPQPDFLKKTIHYFTDPKIGLVQTRWGHLNRDYSLLTRLQAIFLDGHFVMEHASRNWSGRFFNFSGTGGMWRRQAIVDAGGWQHDTLTEDLDISFRSQLENWKFVYVNDVVSPAELPVDMRGYKCQQDRWVKGSMQTSRKILGKLLAAKVPMHVKAEGTVHLMGNTCYFLMMILALLMFPATVFRGQLDMTGSVVVDLAVFTMATISVCIFYILSQREIYGFRGALRTVLYVPCVLALGIGMCISNTRAVFAGLFGPRGGEFVRTPKYAISGREGSPRGKKYKAALRRLVPVVELMMGLWFILIMIISVNYGMYGALPFQALFALGFLYVASLSFLQGKLATR
jgi:cellulose synthase/poly-beta-1,6-N-acetylglucosamine synthase-like glycosyltransferase